MDADVCTLVDILHTCVHIHGINRKICDSQKAKQSLTFCLRHDSAHSWGLVSSRDGKTSRMPKKTQQDSQVFTKIMVRSSIALEVIWHGVWLT